MNQAVEAMRLEESRREKKKWLVAAIDALKRIPTTGADANIIIIKWRIIHNLEGALLEADK